LIVATAAGMLVSPTRADTTPVSNPPHEVRQSSATIIGLVSDMDGKWSIEKNGERKQLGLGEPVYEGWKIQRESAKGSIKLALINKKNLDCPGVLHVGETVSLTKFHQPTDPWWGIFVPVVCQRPGWTWEGARDVDDVYLQDSVLEEPSGKETLDLKRVMEKVPNGNYTGALSASGSGIIYRTSITKDGDAVKAFFPQAISPGLYKLSVTPIGQTRIDHQLEKAMVLVVRHDEYKTYTELFGKASEETEYLGDTTPGGTRAKMLRSFLMALSSGLPQSTLQALK
jgi:hypothetical protein